MADLISTLFEYASNTCLPDYWHDPEYASSYRRYEEAEAALNDLLDDNGKHLLTVLLNEQSTQSALETYAFFRAAFHVCEELHQILQ